MTDMTQASTPGPLDSESVKLLVKGDYVRGPNGKIYRLEEWGDGGFLTFIDEPHDGYLAILCAFIGRPGPDGWMPWSGGENPVPGQKVEVKFRDGQRSSGVSDLWADERAVVPAAWTRANRASDIIAFRLAPTAPVEASGSELTSAQRRSMSIQAAPSAVDAEAAGCAEPQVGRAVYERIEKLLTTDPQGWERDYLCNLVESVEELGGYDGPRLDRRDDRQAVADFLKLRDENVGPGEADDAERLESANDILALLSARPLALGGQHSGGEGLARADFLDAKCPDDEWAGLEAQALRDEATPARAEAQDEGAAGEPVPIIYVNRNDLREFVGGENKMAHLEACLFDIGYVIPLYAHPSTTPAADADRVRDV